MERYPALFVSCRVIERVDSETPDLTRDELVAMVRHAVASGLRILAIASCGALGCHSCASRVQALQGNRQPVWGDPILPVADVIMLRNGSTGADVIREAARRLNIDLERSAVLSLNGELRDAARHLGLGVVGNLDELFRTRWAA